MQAGFASIPRRLRAVDIEPYYTLLSADVVMTYQEFFGVIRAIDRCWFEAYYQHQEKLAAANPPKEPKGQRPKASRGR